MQTGRVWLEGPGIGFERGAINQLLQAGLPQLGIPEIGYLVRNDADANAPSLQRAQQRGYPGVEIVAVTDYPVVICQVRIKDAVNLRFGIGSAAKEPKQVLPEGSVELGGNGTGIRRGNTQLPAGALHKKQVDTPTVPQR